MRRGILIGLLALACAGSAHAATPIQPGASLGGFCTLAFVFDGQGPVAGRVFISTAAHCVNELGQRMTDEAGQEFGTVVLMGEDFYGEEPAVEDGDGPGLDFALIEVDPAHHGRVDPSVAGHTDIPAGVVAPSEVDADDWLQMSGYGTGFGLTQDTRERRKAIFRMAEEDAYHALAMVIFGDSGGPITHDDTGGALGIVSQNDLHNGDNLAGPNVTYLLAVAAFRGFPVRMRSAGEAAPAPPPPPAVQPAATPAPSPAAAPPQPKVKPRPKAKRKKCRKGQRRVRGKCRKARKPRR